MWEKGSEGGGGVLGVGGGGVGLGLGRGLAGLRMQWDSVAMESHSVAALKLHSVPPLNQQLQLQMPAHAPFIVGGHWKEDVGGDDKEHAEHAEHSEEVHMVAAHCKEHKEQVQMEQVQMAAHQRPLHHRAGGERGSSGCVWERWAEQQRPVSAPDARAHGISSAAHAGSVVSVVSLSAHATAAKRETVTVTGGGGVVGSSKELVPSSRVEDVADGASSSVAHLAHAKEHLAHRGSEHVAHRSSSLALHVGHGGRSVAHPPRPVSLAHLPRPVVASSTLHHEQQARAGAGAGVGEVGHRRRRPSSRHLRCLPLDYPTHRDRDTDTDTDRDRDREVWERDGGEGWGSKVGQVCANRHDAASLPPHVAHAAQLADKCKDEDRVSDGTLERRRKVLGMCLYVASMAPLCHLSASPGYVASMCLYVATASMSPLCHLSASLGYVASMFLYVTSLSPPHQPYQPLPPRQHMPLPCAIPPLRRPCIARMKQLAHSTHEAALA